MIRGIFELLGIGVVLGIGMSIGMMVCDLGILITKVLLAFSAM